VSSATSSRDGRADRNPERSATSTGDARGRDRTTTATSSRPTELNRIATKGECPVKLRVRGGYQTPCSTTHPFEWSDGTYSLSWTVLRAQTSSDHGTDHPPPRPHQTFQGRLVIALLPASSTSIARGAHVRITTRIFVGGDDLYGSGSSAREGASTSVDHAAPLRLTHAPQTGLAGESIGRHETHELAGEVQGTRPSVEASKFAKDLDDGSTRTRGTTRPGRADAERPSVGAATQRGRVTSTPVVTTKRLFTR